MKFKFFITITKKLKTFILQKSDINSQNILFFNSSLCSVHVQQDHSKTTNLLFHLEHKSLKKNK